MNIKFLLLACLLVTGTSTYALGDDQAPDTKDQSSVSQTKNLSPSHKVTLTLEPTGEFEELQRAQFKIETAHEKSSPSDATRGVAAAVGFLGDLGFNIMLNNALHKKGSGWTPVVAIGNWIGGSALLTWAYTRILIKRQRLMLLFQRLIQLKKHRTLSLALRTYDVNTLEDSGIRNAFKEFSLYTFQSEEERAAASEQFLDKQISRIASRVYWLSLAASSIGGATFSHLISATLPLSGYSDK